MSEWKEHKLGEFVDIQTGPFGTQLHASDYTSYGIPSIMPTNIGTRLNIITDKIVYVGQNDVDRLEKYTVKENDIVYSRRGDVEKCAFITKVQEGWLCGTGCLRIRFTSTEINPKFCAYYLSSPEIKSWVVNSAVGTTMPNLNTTILGGLPVSMPRIAEQIQIAEILSSLDDKIDLLQRQNKTLEQLAETLFRQWFVEEAEERWEEGKLSDVAVVQNGYAFSSKVYEPFQEGKLEVLKMGHIAAGGGLRPNPKKDFVPREEKLKRWTLNKGDIIMAMTDMKDNVVILGVPAMIDKSDKYVLNQRVARIYLQSNSKILNSYLLYIQMNNPEFIATLQSKANSGVQVNLSTEAIKDCDIIIPPIEVQKKKGHVFVELYLKKENNDVQIQSLTKLRDTLLPKLMCGDIRVND